MKKNRRTITVNGKQYVWWYGIGEGLTMVIISPIEDKTSKVEVKFQDAEYRWEYTNSFTFPLYLELEKDNEHRSLKLIEPGMAALLTAYLAQKSIFKSRKQIELNGYELLKNMGYKIIKIKNGIEF